MSPCHRTRAFLAARPRNLASRSCVIGSTQRSSFHAPGSMHASRQPAPALFSPTRAAGRVSVRGAEDGFLPAQAPPWQVMVIRILPFVVWRTNMPTSRKALCTDGHPAIELEERMGPGSHRAPLLVPPWHSCSASSGARRTARIIGLQRLLLSYWTCIPGRTNGRCRRRSIV